MDAALRILVLEDSASDARLVERALRDGGVAFSAERVETREGFVRALDEGPDLVLADYRLPSFDGLAALRLARERLPLVPVIIVTGTLLDEVAADLLREGAADYILKDRLSRLPAAVRRALDEARAKAERIEAEKRYRTLFEAARDGIVLVDAASGKVVDCNPAFESQAGRRLDQLRSLAMWDLGQPEDAEAIRRTLREAGEGPRGGGGEMGLARPDGTCVQVELLANSIELGGRRFVQSQVRDISARLAAEAQLREQVDELRRFQKVIVDRELRLMELEARVAQMEAAAGRAG